MPPNCELEVDDVSQKWTWTKKFDLIHLRLMIGNFNDDQWEAVYKQAYEYVSSFFWHVP